MNILKRLKRRINEQDQKISEWEGKLAEKEVECPSCHSVTDGLTLRDSLKICPQCGHYFPMTPKERLRMLADEDSFKLLNGNLKTTDPLQFPGYDDKIRTLKEKTKQADAVVTGTLRIGGKKAAIAVMDSRFLMGSMGTVVGEQITALTEYAQKKKLPLIIYCLSGGARMQEGIFSLMQMAKTSAAVERFKSDGGLYISVLCNPTTGGVSASFAFLGDIIFAEPKALIGFAGPRVIEQTIGQSLPEGFQRAESQLENGMIDRIVTRAEQKELLTQILKMHA